jgi:hypothetical protein
MIRLAVLAGLQAAALLAGWPILAPATATGLGILLAGRGGARRIRLGAIMFVSFFAAVSLLAAAEYILKISGPPGYGRYAILSLRGFASFLIALAGTRMFTLTEGLCFLRRMRIPGYVLTMIYLMVQDLAVFVRLVDAMSESIRARGAGIRKFAKIGMLAHASGNFMVLAAGKYRYRHEFLLARGLDLDLPLDDWRSRERLRQS